MERKEILILFLILIFLLSIFFPFPSQKEGRFLVEKGEGLREIGKKLVKEGFLKSSLPFYFFIFFEGKEKELKSGSYFIKKNDNFITIAKKIISGQTIKTKITFPEGLRLKEIEEKLVREKIIPENSLSKLKISDFKNQFSFLENIPAELSLEGFLFPDTYFFEPEMEPEEVAKVFLKNFEKKISPEVLAKIALEKKNIFDIIIIASLLEKEVKNIEEKKLVSGILWKRLRNNIPLQVDATITYITGKRTTKISIEETEIEHPYNTYKYLGLPPGPISNPGLDSILAAFYPKDSEYWYYLSTPEGKTHFSQTLKEHNIKKAKYLW